LVKVVYVPSFTQPLDFENDIVKQFDFTQMQQMMENSELQIFGWARRHNGQICLSKEDFAMQTAMEQIYPTNLAVAVCSEGSMLSWRMKDGIDVRVDDVYYENRGPQSKGMVMRQAAAADPAADLPPGGGRVPETRRSKRARAAFEKASSSIDDTSQEPTVVDPPVALWMCYLLACVFTLCVCVLLALFFLPAGFEEASEVSSRGSASR
jgi:hypothetical protein